MISIEQAREIVETLLIRESQKRVTLIIQDGYVKEEDFAWIFPITSQEYQKSKSKGDMPLGSYPIIIDKIDGQVYRIGFDDIIKLTDKTYTLKQICMEQRQK